MSRTFQNIQYTLTQTSSGLNIKAKHLVNCWEWESTFTNKDIIQTNSSNSYAEFIDVDTFYTILTGIVNPPEGMRIGYSNPTNKDETIKIHFVYADKENTSTNTITIRPVILSDSELHSRQIARLGACISDIDSTIEVIRKDTSVDFSPIEEKVKLLNETIQSDKRSILSNLNSIDLRLGEHETSVGTLNSDFRTSIATLDRSTRNNCTRVDSLANMVTSFIADNKVTTGKCLSLIDSIDKKSTNDINEVYSQFNYLESRVEKLEEQDVSGQVSTIYGTLHDQHELIKSLSDRINTQVTSDSEQSSEVTIENLNALSEHVNKLQEYSYAEFDSIEENLEGITADLSSAQENIEHVSAEMHKYEQNHHFVCDKLDTIEEQISELRKSEKKNAANIAFDADSQDKKNAALWEVVNVHEDAIDTHQGQLSRQESRITKIEKELLHKTVEKPVSTKMTSGEYDEIQKTFTNIRRDINRLSEQTRKEDPNHHSITSEEYDDIQKAFSSIRRDINRLSEQTRKEDASYQKINKSLSSLSSRVEAIDDKVTFMDESTTKELESLYQYIGDGSVDCEVEYEESVHDSRMSQLEETVKLLVSQQAVLSRENQKLGEENKLLSKKIEDLYKITTPATVPKSSQIARVLSDSTVIPEVRPQSTPSKTARPPSPLVNNNRKTPPKPVQTVISPKLSTADFVEVDNICNTIENMLKARSPVQPVVPVTHVTPIVSVTPKPATPIVNSRFALIDDICDILAEIDSLTPRRG